MKTGGMGCQRTSVTGWKFPAAAHPRGSRAVQLFNEETMTRSVAARVLLALTLLISTAVGIAVAQDQAPSTQPAATGATASAAPLLQYSLPPDKLAKAYALYLVNGVLYFAAGLWSIVVLCLMLRSRFGARLRNWAERVSRRRFVQAAVVMSLFVLVMEVAQFPLRYLQRTHQHQVRPLGTKLGIMVRRLGQRAAAGLHLRQRPGLDSVRGIAPQPAPLVVLLLAGADPDRRFRDVSCAGVD